jgi:hypothetical protein
MWHAWVRRKNKKKILHGKLKEKQSRGKQRWENNVKIDTRKISRKCVDWVLLAQDR